MNFQGLKLFLDLVQNRSFTKTAAQNYMSPSTLSRHIQRIEEEIGQPLLLRDNRQVKLTEAGKYFLSFAKTSWSEWIQLQHYLSPHKAQLTGELNIFCSVTAAYSHLPTILANFRQYHPNIEIKLTTGDPAQAVHNVQSMQADLSLTGKPEVLPQNIDFHYIDDIPLSLIAPKISCKATQLLAQRPIDWQKIPFILPLDGPVRQRIDHWFKSQKIRHPKIYTTVAGHEAIVSLVALGFGVALLPDVVIQHSPMNNQIDYLELPFPIKPFELGFCVQHRRLQEPVISAFWNLLK